MIRKAANWVAGILLFTSLVQSTTITSIQEEEKVKWSFSSEVKESEAVLMFTASIAPTWHMYSANMSADAGPVPTSFSIEQLEGCELVGSMKEPQPTKVYDPNFDAEVRYFSKEVTFKQKIKLTGGKAAVKGFVTYMVCDDHKCLPHRDVPFDFQLN